MTERDRELMRRLRAADAAAASAGTASGDAGPAASDGVFNGTLRMEDPDEDWRKRETERKARAAEAAARDRAVREELAAKTAREAADKAAEYQALRAKRKVEDAAYEATCKRRPDGTCPPRAIKQ